MLEQVKKVVVVARKGYSVLLEIEGRMFDIDCHEAINLSDIFSADVLERCSSLATHLKDGNLVVFTSGTVLSKDATTPVEIVTLREETAQHITSQYDQAERDVNRTNMELETRANITEETRKHIQEQVQIGRKKILQVDQKFMPETKAAQTVKEVDSSSKARQTAMTAEELTMKVSMDISPEDFAKKQVASKNELEAAEEAAETRAAQEIAKQDVNEQG
ncbi:hypothetical protein LCGC14_2427280 [marine sediment metagenome]|uniref:Uncharacterized protein n=1 Tax=marine sediment metagenome TaxID=412755 RepID=A0A0F9BMZ7_9ZZZZ